METKYILDITIKETNTFAHLQIPVELFKYAKIDSKLSFLLGKKTSKILEIILPLLEHATSGILIETEQKEAYVKIEVIEYED